MIKHLLYIICIAFFAVSCSDTITAITDPDTPENPSDDENMVGKPVQFVCVGKAPQATTRSAEDGKDDVYEVEGFTYAGKNPNIDKFYRFNITMAKKSSESESNPTTVSSALYDIKEIDSDVTPPTEDDALTGGLEQRAEGSLDNGTTPTDKNYLGDGTLVPAEGETPLYWPDNVNEYGFHVVSNDGTLRTNQSDPATLTGTESELEASSGYNFWSNDYLEGYGYIPGRFDVLNNYNFRTTNKWYTHNQMVWKGALAANNITALPDPEMYKRVPLYMVHKRAWITVILKAGNGIKRETLYYSATGGNSLSSSEIYSKVQNSTADDFLAIKPWRQPATVDYEEDKNGKAGTESSTALHAIVEPHNYGIDELLTKIVLNGQTFTYAPNNDGEHAYEKYNLEAGKHLIITANLTTDRIVLITAHIEDWEDVTYSSICDDYGQQGDPFIINTRDQLRAFLLNTDKYNKPGNVALIAAKVMDLEKAKHEEANLQEVLTKGYTYPAGATERDSKWEPLPLYCTLNLAGCKISSAGQMFSNIDRYGSLVNGTVIITGDRGKYTAPETTGGTGSFNTDQKMPAAICQENRGTIEQINVTVAETITDNSVYATQGGIAAINYGHILSCSNDLEVRGTSGYLGGIAGQSLQATYQENNQTIEGTLPIIDHCTVNGRVGIDDNATNVSINGVGGIVGKADYRVTYNTFNYGIPFNYQIIDATENGAGYGKYKNIVQESGNNLLAENNSWPTGATNSFNGIANTNIFSGVKYAAVLDCQNELELIITTPNYNNSGAKYRIARDFEVSSEWGYGIITQSAQTEHNIVFELDGNDKTISTNGKMLFTNIRGYIHDLTVFSKLDVIEPGTAQNTESVSPFAYSVQASSENGYTGRLKNIKIKMADEKKITAPIPSGLVVMAYGGALIEDCKVDADLQVKLVQPADGQVLNNDMRLYCGGIVSQASTVTLSGCHFYGSISADNQTWITDAHLFFRGGIVGGVVFDNKTGDSNPKTVINDCASWWGEKKPATNPDKWSPAGSIIGSQYWFRGTTQQDGILDGSCTGNWWHSEFNPIGDISGESEAESKVGKRNSIQPDREDF